MFIKISDNFQLVLIVYWTLLALNEFLWVDLDDERLTRKNVHAAGKEFDF